MIHHLDSENVHITVSTLVKDPKRLRILIDEGDKENAQAVWADLTVTDALQLCSLLNKVVMEIL